MFLVLDFARTDEFFYHRCAGDGCLMLDVGLDVPLRRSSVTSSITPTSEKVLDSARTDGSSTALRHGSVTSSLTGLIMKSKEITPDKSFLQ